MNFFNYSNFGSNLIHNNEFQSNQWLKLYSTDSNKLHYGDNTQLIRDKFNFQISISQQNGVPSSYPRDSKPTHFQIVQPNNDQYSSNSIRSPSSKGINNGDTCSGNSILFQSQNIIVFIKN